eukprot:scaffold10090_cov54-Phaeocystis_antarctica.AAC.2
MTYYLSLSANYRLLTTARSLLAAYCLPIAAYYLLGECSLARPFEGSSNPATAASTATVPCNGLNATFDEAVHCVASEPNLTLTLTLASTLTLGLALTPNLPLTPTPTNPDPNPKPNPNPNPNPKSNPNPNPNPYPRCTASRANRRTPCYA